MIDLKIRERAREHRTLGSHYTVHAIIMFGINVKFEHDNVTVMLTDRFNIRRRV